jgi:hypothetical protein
VIAGLYHSCAVRNDGTLACWGWDYQGQAPRLSIQPVVLTGALGGAAYSQVLRLVDTSAKSSTEFTYIPVTPGFAVVSGSLPPGLGLSAAGLLSGTPAHGGTSSFLVEGEDANGFTAQRSYDLAVEGPADSTPPVIVPTIVGTSGNSGWYIGDVGITWSVSDEQSTVFASNGCTPATVVSDSGGTSYTCTATSAGGTASESVLVKRDATAPSLAPLVTPNAIVLNGSASAAPNAADALSGIATQSCAAVDALSVGIHTIACTAIDIAGNTAKKSATYSVTYGFGGFSPPVDNPPTINFANAGRTVPFKWHLVDATGSPITSLGGVTLRAIGTSCDGSALADEVELYASEGNGFINRGNGDYQFNWQSPTAYQASCKRIELDMGDGSAHASNFWFH